MQKHLAKEKENWTWLQLDVKNHMHCQCTFIWQKKKIDHEARPGPKSQKVSHSFVIYAGFTPTFPWLDELKHWTVGLSQVVNY